MNHREAWLPDWVDNSRIGSGAAPDGAFDEFLNLSEEDQARLYDALRGAMERGRKRKPPADVEERYRQVVGCIVANAIVAMERGPRTRIHYSRAKDSYVGEGSPYHPPWLTSKLLRRAVDQLKAAGFLITATGRPGTFHGPGEHRSTYEGSPSLQTVLRDLGITAQHVVRDETSAPVVFLRGSDKRLESYDVSEPTVAASIDVLRRWNAQIRDSSIALDLPEEVSLASPLDLSATRLVRLFDGSFEGHGRFYGGWWQNQPEKVRQHITINQERTVELDFQGLVARMLYHQEGREFAGDPYAIPEIMEAAKEDGLPWEDVRPVVKEVFNFALNAKKRGGYDQSTAFDGWPPSLSKKAGVEAVERFHAPIKHRFFKQEALKLMNTDSRICESVMEAGQRDGVVVLPIHDSFIVAERHESWLREQMVKAYREQMGYSPTIV